MSLLSFKKTRDKGAPRHLLTFRYGPNASDYYAYTDQAGSIELGTDGRSRVYFSIDRSIRMAESTGVSGGTRFAVARSALIYALNQIRAKVLLGDIFDIVVAAFDSTAIYEMRMGASATDVDSLIAWVNALATTSNVPNYFSAQIHPKQWFSSSSDTSKFRAWVFISDGRPYADTLPQAKESITDIISNAGSDELGFVPINVFAIGVGNPDIRELRWFDNTPADGVPILTALDSNEVWKAVESVREYGILYESTPIKITGGKVASSTETKSTITIEIAKSSAVAQRYVANKQRTPMYLVIKKGQAEDSDQQFITGWQGRVVSCKPDPIGTTATLTCEPLSSSMRRVGLRRFYMYGCPHPLYGSLCRASIGAVTESFVSQQTEAAANQRYMAFPTGFIPAQTLARYLGGLVWWEIDGHITRRTIVQAYSGGFNLSGTIDDLMLAPKVSMAIGCAHTIDACREWHTNTETGGSNVVNYGGQDLIPFENPFTFKNNYV